jgi:hypothetical protein
MFVPLFKADVVRLMSKRLTKFPRQCGKLRSLKIEEAAKR